MTNVSNLFSAKVKLKRIVLDMFWKTKAFLPNSVFSIPFCLLATHRADDFLERAGCMQEGEKSREKVASPPNPFYPPRFPSYFVLLIKGVNAGEKGFKGKSGVVAGRMKQKREFGTLRQLGEKQQNENPGWREKDNLLPATLIPFFRNAFSKSK